jgi:hypothetical protein
MCESRYNLQLEEVTDPDEIARHREVAEAGRRNSDWLEAHWGDLLPGARGRFVAVAGQQAFVAHTPEEAIALAKAAHPDDPGLLIRYVIPQRGWRVYAHRGNDVLLRAPPHQYQVTRA